MVKESFQLQNEGFSSILGSVQGNIYISPTAAGGEGKEIDFNQDGKADVTFNKPCKFILQLENEKVIAVEVDRPVTMQMDNGLFSLEAYQPIKL